MADLCNSPSPGTLRIFQNTANITIQPVRIIQNIKTVQKIVSGEGLGVEIVQHKWKKREAPHIFRTFVAQSRPPDPLRTNVHALLTFCIIRLVPGDGLLHAVLWLLQQNMAFGK